MLWPVYLRLLRYCPSPPSLLLSSWCRQLLCNTAYRRHGASLRSPQEGRGSGCFQRATRMQRATEQQSASLNGQRYNYITKTEQTQCAMMSTLYGLLIVQSLKMCLVLHILLCLQWCSICPYSMLSDCLPVSHQHMETKHSHLSLEGCIQGSYNDCLP